KHRTERRRKLHAGPLAMQCIRHEQANVFGAHAGQGKLLEQDRDDQSTEVGGGHRDDRNGQVVERDRDLGAGPDEGPERLLADRFFQRAINGRLWILEGRQRRRRLQDPRVIRENGCEGPLPAPDIPLHPAKDTRPWDPFVGTCVPLPLYRSGPILTPYVSTLHTDDAKRHCTPADAAPVDPRHSRSPPASRQTVKSDYGSKARTGYEIRSAAGRYRKRSHGHATRIF